MSKKQSASGERTLDDFLLGKSPHTVELFNTFVSRFLEVGKVTIHPTKTMIGIATTRKRVAYVIQLGKNFVDVVFPFKEPYEDNLCFRKISQVPGVKQFNHHLRILEKEDVNKEVVKFMKLAFLEGS